jgi:hypothetical protein
MGVTIKNHWGSWKVPPPPKGKPIYLLLSSIEKDRFAMHHDEIQLIESPWSTTKKFAGRTIFPSILVVF